VECLNLAVVDTHDSPHNIYAYLKGQFLILNYAHRMRNCKNIKQNKKKIAPPLAPVAPSILPSRHPDKRAVACGVIP
jgi:hypothetical protein